MSVSKSTLLRMGWYVLGGAMSYAANVGLFLLLTKELHLGRGVAYAVSLGVLTLANFAWSYAVNFRTSKPLHDCAGRYVATIGIGFVVNYAFAQAGFALFPTKPKLVILIAQAFVAGVKFFIYHWWVFPDSEKVKLP